MNTAFKGFKKGTRVEDLWFKDWGLGVVVKRAKTKLYVRFSGSAADRWCNDDGLVVWDGPHVRQFLKKA